MNSQKAYTIHVQEERAGEVLLSLSGRLEKGNLNAFLSEAKTFFKEKAPQKIVVDLSKVEFLDGAGALGPMELEDGAKAHPIPFRLVF